MNKFDEARRRISVMFCVPPKQDKPPEDRGEKSEPENKNPLDRDKDPL